MPSLTKDLSAEYGQLLLHCVVNPPHVAEADAIVDRIMAGKPRYQVLADRIGCPWVPIGLIHNMESGLSFKTHLYNGDPLTARTVHEPAGRPKHGAPPFTWEASAEEALRQHDFDTWNDWTGPGMLYRLEAYNGFGYRNQHPEVLSPYLWSFTNHYTRGKFVGDHQYSATAVSKQCGAVALLVRMQQRGLVSVDGAPGALSIVSIPKQNDSGPAAGGPPPFPGVALARHVSSGPDVCRVQSRLRALGHHIDAIAGCPYGPQTETAVKLFQRQHGLQDSGRVGSDTWRALFS